MEIEKDVETQTGKIMTADEVSENIFGGTKSAWAVLTAARKKQIPSIRIGRRVYFDYFAIRRWMLSESEKSINTVSENGIRKL